MPAAASVGASPVPSAAAVEVDAEPDEEVPRLDDEDEMMYPELVDRASISSHMRLRSFTRDLRNAEEELKKMVEENQVTLARKAKAEEALGDARAELEDKKKLDASTTSTGKFLLVKAEKERDRFKEDKKRLEYMIEELLKQEEGFTTKIKKIKYT
ncbi:hypothetical protein D1007_09231 [Hordeum vulgare]|nr:hypothetical protein D1007_09231 [Hordeum vulgare]